MSDLIVPENNMQPVTQDALDTGLEHNAGEQQFLTFVLDNENYAVDILKVQEIRGWTQVTQMPNAPHYVRGVMNLRGAIVPILDLRRRFDMNEMEFTAQTVVVVVHVQGRTIGMIVDQVSDVMDIPVKNMHEAPDFGTSIDSSFIQGLVSMEEKMIILLDVDKMLQSCELLELDKVKKDATSELY